MAHLDEDEDPLEELIAMGFEEAQASAALAAAGGDLQAAVDWCFEQEDGQLPAQHSRSRSRSLSHRSMS